MLDLGMTGKVRPAVVLSVEPADNERALITLVPHTTSVRGSRFEVKSSATFLKEGAFDAQGLVTVPPPRLIRLLGTLRAADLEAVEEGVCRWLGIEGFPPAR
jgi:mRNA interferase MazF